MHERLAGYLTVLGLATSEEPARLMAGQFHDVVLAGEVAYRFPRDEESRRKLPGAVALLSVLGCAGLPVPGVLGTGHIGDQLGRCHAPLTRLPGEPLERVSGQQVDAVVTELAGLLDRLAGAGADPAVQAAVPRASADHWVDFSSQVRDVLYPMMSAAGRRRADAELAAVTTVSPAGGALVHTDLGGANLLWASAGGVPELTGVLDWDGACIGDQAADLASIAATFGWQLAGRIDSRHQGARPMLADARIIAATFALQQALPAARSNDQVSLDDGLREYR